ncbi:MAG: hypothetical protein AAGM84_09600 [Pseudomonadota bacterium]
MSDVQIDIETLNRDVAFQPARLLVVGGMAAVAALAALVLAMPLWMMAALAFIVAVKLFQPLLVNAEGQVSRVRLLPGMIAIEDRKTMPGQARAVRLEEIARVDVYDVYLTLRLKSGGHDGAVIKKPDIDALTRAITAELTPEPA